MAITALPTSSIQLSSPIVDPTSGRPLPSFTQVLNNALANDAAAIRAIGEQSTTTANLVDQIVSLNGLITSASGAATAAQSQVSALAQLVALVSSFTVPTGVLSAVADASTATISIAAHSRRYATGSTVSVASGTITGLALSTPYWVYYSDPAHAGGPVTFTATQNAIDAAQIGGIHCVGKIVTPAVSSSSTGIGNTPPGVPE